MVKHQLKQKLSLLQRGDHSCFIYNNKEDQLAVVVPFLIIGLERNEKNVFLADPLTLIEAKEAIAQAGIDVDAEIKRGALNFVSERNYLENGKFYPQSMLRFLEKAVDESLAAGFAGLRATGDVIWELGEGVSLQELFLYEAMLDYFFEQKKLVGLCQYCRQIPPQFIRHSMYTHPNIVFNAEVFRNHRFYNPSHPCVIMSEDLEVKALEEMCQGLFKKD
jgi:hypothetical protein